MIFISNPCPTSIGSEYVAHCHNVGACWPEISTTSPVQAGEQSDRLPCGVAALSATDDPPRVAPWPSAASTTAPACATSPPGLEHSRPVTWIEQLLVVYVLGQWLHTVWRWVRKARMRRWPARLRQMVSRVAATAWPYRKSAPAPEEELPF